MYVKYQYTVAPALLISCIADFSASSLSLSLSLSTLFISLCALHDVNELYVWVKLFNSNWKQIKPYGIIGWVGKCRENPETFIAKG